MEARELFEIIKTAIENERDAYNFYMTAAAGATDPETKRLFEKLADMELGHEKKLEERYRVLKARLSPE